MKREMEKSLTNETAIMKDVFCVNAPVKDLVWCLVYRSQK